MLYKYPSLGLKLEVLNLLLAVDVLREGSGYKLALAFKQPALNRCSSRSTKLRFR